MMSDHDYSKMSGEAKGWTIFGVAAMAALVALMLNFSSCVIQQNQIESDRMKSCVDAGGSYIPARSGGSDTSGGLCFGKGVTQVPTN